MLKESAKYFPVQISTNSNDVGTFLHATFCQKLDFGMYLFARGISVNNADRELKPVAKIFQNDLVIIGKPILIFQTGFGDTVPKIHDQKYHVRNTTDKSEPKINVSGKIAI